MATTTTEIAKYLYEEGFRFKTEDERDLVLTGFTTKNYINAEGENKILIQIQLEENGEYIKIFAANAFKVSKERAALFAQACGMVQWRTKLIQFEYDHVDGEVRPMVEFPIEDSTLTRKQLMRCLHGLVTLIDEYFFILDRAIKQGVIEFPGEQSNTGNQLVELLDALPPELLEAVLRSKRK